MRQRKSRPYGLIEQSVGNRGSLPHRGLLLFLLVLVTMGINQAVARNVRLVQTQQVANQITGVVRWNAPSNPRGTPPPENYEVEVRNDTVVVSAAFTEADGRAVSYTIPYPCGDTIRLNGRVRAHNGLWPQPSAWSQSATQVWFRQCPVIISGPPEGVELEADTVNTAPVDTVPPLGVTDLTYLGNFVLGWTEVSDGAGGPANYALRYGCPTLSWATAFPTEVRIVGTQVGNAGTVQIAPPMPPCEYRMVSYRGVWNEETQRVDGVFGGFSNRVTVNDTAVTEPQVMLPLMVYPDGTARWLHDQPDNSFHIFAGQQYKQCFYAVRTIAHNTETGEAQNLVYGMWPADCPTTELGLPADLRVYEDSEIGIRCAGADSIFTPWTPADGANLQCGEQAHWQIIAAN